MSLEAPPSPAPKYRWLGKPLPAACVLRFGVIGLWLVFHVAQLGKLVKCMHPFLCLGWPAMMPNAALIWGGSQGPGEWDGKGS